MLKMKYWQCPVCKYIHEGDEPPEECPICGVPGSEFVEIDKPDGSESRKNKEEASTPEIEEPAVTSTTVSETPVLDEPVEEKGIIGQIERLLVKHHAHPVSVHTPNGVLPMAVILYILAWLFNSKALANAAMISQIFVLLSLPVVIYTGTVEWRRKYLGATTTIFKIKIIAAALTTVTCIITLAWYLIDPGILNSGKSGVFILLNVLMLGCAGVAGHIGGKLVFKD